MVMPMQKDILRLLIRLGLKDREARIYLTCLASSDGLFLHQIVQRTKIIRSSVDLMVKRLAQRGFLNRIKVGRRFRFFAQSPEALLFRQRQLAEDFERAVPLLSNIGGQKKDAEIFFFEGAQGFRDVHNEALLNIKFAEGQKKDILALASGTDSMRLFPDMQRVFIEKRIRNGSWYKAIVPASSQNVKEYRSDPKALREIKSIPSDSFKFHIEMQIYADNVMIYSPVAPVSGVIIRNEKVADSLRSLFYVIWGMVR
jgi:sugar-specific transcriptional regulator TrmB